MCIRDRLSNDHASRRHSPDVLIQREIEGESIGVTFQTNPSDDLGAPNSSQILGVTRSLPCDAHPWSDWIYRGSEGPVQLTPAKNQMLAKFARIVADATRWSGVWQADFIDAIDGLYLLELNPRWTSGMEILSHCGLVESTDSLDSSFNEPQLSFLRKEILYSRAEWQVSSALSDSLWALRKTEFQHGAIEGLSWVADIPMPDAYFGIGYPICSLISAGLGRDECLSSMWQIKEKLANLDPRLIEIG